MGQGGVDRVAIIAAERDAVISGMPRKGADQLSRK